MRLGWVVAGNWKVKLEFVKSNGLSGALRNCDFFCGLELSVTLMLSGLPLKMLKVYRALSFTVVVLGMSCATMI
jgi:hypothetical protein